MRRVQNGSNVCPWNHFLKRKLVSLNPSSSEGREKPVWMHPDNVFATSHPPLHRSVQLSIQELLYRNVQRFRGRLVSKAHRLYVPLNSRRESNQERNLYGCIPITSSRLRTFRPPRSSRVWRLFRWRSQRWSRSLKCSFRIRSSTTYDPVSF